MDMIWPIKTATQAAPDRPGTHWQVANLTHDVKKTIAPTRQTGLTNKTMYVKAWADLQPYTLSTASNTFFTSTQVTFAEKKNVWKARYGTLWNKKIAFRHRAAYMPGEGMTRNTRCPLCGGGRLLRQWMLWEPVGNDFLSGWSPQQP